MVLVCLSVIIFFKQNYRNDRPHAVVWELLLGGLVHQLDKDYN